MTCKVHFIGSDNSTVELNEGDNLSEKLTIQNSPILFGCRIGICGTCAIEVVESDTPLPPRSYDEEQFLETMAPGRKNLRLACQVEINSNIKIKKAEI